MEAPKATLVEPGHAGTVALHRGADALERADDSLPGVCDAGRVRRDEPERGAAGERFSEAQAGADAMGLGGGGCLADQRLAPDLRGQGQRSGGERFSATRGDRELEARQKDTDDHR